MSPDTPATLWPFEIISGEKQKADQDSTIQI